MRSSKVFHGSHRFPFLTSRLLFRFTLLVRLSLRHNLAIIELKWTELDWARSASLSGSSLIFVVICGLVSYLKTNWGSRHATPNANFDSHVQHNLYLKREREADRQREGEREIKQSLANNGLRLRLGAKLCRGKGGRLKGKETQMTSFALRLVHFHKCHIKEAAVAVAVVAATRRRCGIKWH